MYRNLNILYFQTKTSYCTFLAKYLFGTFLVSFSTGVQPNSSIQNVIYILQPRLETERLVNEDYVWLKLWKVTIYSLHIKLFWLQLCTVIINNIYLLQMLYL